MRRFVRSPDPIVILIGGVIEVAASLGVFARLELSGDDVAQLGAGLVMIGSAIRIFVRQRQRSRFDPPTAPPATDADPGYSSQR